MYIVLKVRYCILLSGDPMLPCAESSGDPMLPYEQLSGDPMLPYAELGGDPMLPYAVFMHISLEGGGLHTLHVFS